MIWTVRGGLLIAMRCRFPLLLHPGTQILILKGKPILIVLLIRNLFGKNIFIVDINGAGREEYGEKKPVNNLLSY